MSYELQIVTLELRTKNFQLEIRILVPRGSTNTCLQKWTHDTGNKEIK